MPAYETILLTHNAAEYSAMSSDSCSDARAATALTRYCIHWLSFFRVVLLSLATFITTFLHSSLLCRSSWFTCTLSVSVFASQYIYSRRTSSFFFFFNDPAPPEISPLPLPAALPI